MDATWTVNIYANINWNKVQLGAANVDFFFGVGYENIWCANCVPVCLIWLFFPFFLLGSFFETNWEKWIRFSVSLIFLFDEENKFWNKVFFKNEVRFFLWENGFLMEVRFGFSGTKIKNHFFWNFGNFFSWKNWRLIFEKWKFFL